MNVRRHACAHTHTHTDTHRQTHRQTYQHTDSWLVQMQEMISKAYEAADEEDEEEGGKGGGAKAGNALVGSRLGELDRAVCAGQGLCVHAIVEPAGFVL